ncbi:MAG: DUF4160 domain-containing protein [Caldithrix sp.]|nr:MAG: DUF4160 domain-containing protein [Caldithrix sp.]
MFMEPNAPHHRPHFHAYYQNDVAIYAIDSIEIIAGSFQIRQQRLVEAWAEIHQEELLSDWDLLQTGQPPLRIEPLK